MLLIICEFRQIGAGKTYISCGRKLNYIYDRKLFDVSKMKQALVKDVHYVTDCGTF
jgi:hypothetical protein